MRIGIDLGGTKVSGVLMDDSGDVAARLRRESPRGDYDATLTMLCDVITELTPTSHPDAPVGIGLPGTVSPATGLIKNANSTWLIGQPFDRDLAERSGRRIRTANDADCFALSEAVDGAGADDRTVFGVILGTGVGGGFVIDGRLLSGPNAIAGEWGHNPLPWRDHNRDPAHPCYCGKDGCIETYLSGPGLSAHFKARTGTARRAEDVAGSDDEAARACMGEYTDRLARALAHVINILDPEVVVLGGGLSGIDSLYRDVPGIWGRYVFSDTVETKLLKNRHGADSGVRGAAWLWPAGGNP